MHGTPRGLLFAPQNPIARAFAVIAGLGLFAVTLFLGVIFFAAFAALGVLAWAWFSVRRWWLTRGRRPEQDPDIIDVEYRVVREGRQRRRR